MKIKLLALFLILVIFLGACTVPHVNTLATGNTYYVSLTGNDANLGTIDQPWKTLAYGVYRLAPGDTLYIRGGTYYERLYVSKNGTSTSLITISGYPGETVIIDGNNYTNPALHSGSGLLQTVGSWLYISNITLTKSGDMGAEIEIGAHVTLDNIFAHHNWGAGIILQGDYDTVINSRSWNNSLMNTNGSMTIGWGTGISCARYPDHCTIKSSVAWENWGEGISTFETTNTVMEDNISYNNMMNFYVSDTQNTTLQRNLGYCTLGNIIKPTSGQNGNIYTQTNFGIWDEIGVPIVNGVANPSGTRQASQNNRIINNVALGCDRGMAISGAVSTNNLYANNTLVNSLPSYDPATIYFYAGSCTNCKFVNNIIEQDTTNVPISNNDGVPGILFSNNLWSREPVSSLLSASDIIANPQLTKTGATTAGNLTGDWFRLMPTSPAINRALLLSQVADDYWKNIRDTLPDIGANEYQPIANGTPTNTPIVIPTNVPTSTYTSTPTPTRTQTSTPTRTSTVVSTNTSTKTPTKTPTLIPTPTPKPKPCNHHFLWWCW